MTDGTTSVVSSPVSPTGPSPTGQLLFMNTPSRIPLYVPQVIREGHKIWMRCAKCGKWVRFNKPLLGDLHFCVGE